MSRLVTLEEVCELVTDGTHYTPTNVGSGVPFLTVKDVSDSGLDFANCSMISDDDYRTAKEGNSAPQLGDVLFSKDGTVGKVHVVATDRPFAVLSSLAILRPVQGVTDARYLGHALRSPVVLGEAISRKTGSAIRRIVLSDLKRVRVPLPPLPEQRRTAQVLDRTEALRAKRRAALAQLDTLTQSIFLDMFGDPASNPKGWPRRRIGHLGKVATGGTPPSAKPGMFGGPIPFITPGDLENQGPAKRSLTVVGAAEGATVRAGATFVCCIGATIGKMGVATMRSAFNQQINAVEWGEAVDDRYGYWVLRFFKPTIIAWAASTTLPILKKSTFEQLEVPIPPLELQQAFSRRLAAIRGLDSSSRAASAMLDELFLALQFRAFRGELQP